MKRYRLRQGKLRPHDAGQWVAFDEAERLEQLIPMIERLAAMMGHWKVPNLPAVYQGPMRELVEAAEAAKGGAR